MYCTLRYCIVWLCTVPYSTVLGANVKAKNYLQPLVFTLYVCNAPNKWIK